MTDQHPTMNRVVFVKAHGRPIGAYKKMEVPTNASRRGLLGIRRPVTRTIERWVQKGYSDSEIDADRLVRDMQAAIQTLNADGYEVISVTPVISGRSREGRRSAGGKSNDHGFSYTEGMIITARSGLSDGRMAPPDPDGTPPSD